MFALKTLVNIQPQSSELRKNMRLVLIVVECLYSSVKRGEKKKIVHQLLDSSLEKELSR